MEESVFVQTVLDGRPIGDLVEKEVVLPIENLEGFVLKLRNCGENVLIENGINTDELHPQMMKVVFTHPKLPDKVVQLTKPTQVKDGYQFAVELFRYVVQEV